MGVEIIMNDMDFAALIGLDDTVQEVEELDAPTVFVLVARDHARGNIKGGKQSRRALAFAVVSLAGEPPPTGQSCINFQIGPLSGAAQYAAQITRLPTPT